MKRSCKVSFFVILLLTSSLFAQNYTNVDSRVKGYPEFNAITDLGYRIMNDYTGETQRVRAAFIWITHNIAFGIPKNNARKHSRKIKYSTLKERDRQIDDFVFSKIDRSFEARTGVCIDYSLMLNALFEQFGLPTKVISGLGKTDVTDIGGGQLFKNHTWNAVRIDGEWKLMDATWAAGYIDEKSGKFVRSYLEHYFFMLPSEFILNHFPVKEEWQLLEKAVDLASFLGTPIFMPDYFNRGIKLSRKTKGTLITRDLGNNYLYFDALPDNHVMHYKLNGSDEFKRMGFKKLNKKAFKSKIRVKNNLKKEHNYLTVYHEYQPILNFKIER